MKYNIPSDATAYMLNTSNERLYLKLEDGRWYSWGYKTPHTLERSQWNRQNNSVIEYFIVEPKLVTVQGRRQRAYKVLSPKNVNLLM